MINTNKIVIFGTSGHAKVIVDIIESLPEYDLVGFIDNLDKVGNRILDYPIIGNDLELSKLMNHYQFNKGVIGIGDNFIRYKIAEKIIKIAPNFEFINCVHSSAKLSKHCILGVGNVIMPGVTINASSVIANHCILNTNSSLDHDCEMMDYSSLAPNSVVGGNCSIGNFSHIGIGASIFHGISIGNNSIVGGGSVVSRDTDSNSTLFGIPAKRKSNRKLGDKYL